MKRSQAIYWTALFLIATWIGASTASVAFRRSSGLVIRDGDKNKDKQKLPDGCPGLTGGYAGDCGKDPGQTANACEWFWNGRKYGSHEGDMCVIKSCAPGFIPCGKDDHKVPDQMDVTVNMRCCGMQKDNCGADGAKCDDGTGKNGDHSYRGCLVQQDTRIVRCGVVACQWGAKLNKNKDGCERTDWKNNDAYRQ